MQILEVKKALLFILLFMKLSLYGGTASYILCFDGGGTKTIFQVINQEGHILPLLQNGIKQHQTQAAGSNINIIGIEGVRAILRELLENVKIGEKNQDLISILSHCQVVAGMAGASLPENKQAVRSVFEEWGINREQILVMSDAELALQLIEGQGIILISGTGSVCFGKNNQNLFRVGGLGRILGDEGSGYQIGLQALKAALAEEYGWGASTSLTSALKAFFSVAELKSLIPKINSGEMSPSSIASMAPIVFTQAWEGDLMAQDIIQCAAGALGCLLTQMLLVSHLSDCEVHLWGGIFKSPYADAFIQKIMDKIPVAEKNLKILNQAHGNAAALYVSKMILSRELTISRL